MDFDVKAAGWDNEKRISRAEAIADAVWAAVKGVTPRRVLDFGCGTGLVAMPLREKFKEMVLVDSSEGMIEQVKAKVSQSGATDMSAIRADLMEGDAIPGAPFDAIYASMSLHHIREVDRVVHTLVSLLRDGGALCVVELTDVDADFHSSEPDFDGHNGFDVAAFHAVMTGAGLRVVSTHRFFQGVKAGGETPSKYTLFEMTGVK